MSKPSTELIMQRLFKIAQATNTAVTPYKMMSRRFQHFTNVAITSMPAFFQFQSPVRRTEGGDRGIPRDFIGVDWLVYLPGSTGPNDVVSPALNNYYDALSVALLTAAFDANGNVTVGARQAGGIQTLGFSQGSVNCYKDGDGLTDEGLLEPPSLIRIPIKILVGI